MQPRYPKPGRSLPNPYPGFVFALDGAPTLSPRDTTAARAARDARAGRHPTQPHGRTTVRHWRRGPDANCINRSCVDEDERTHVETNGTESTLATVNEAKSKRTQAWGLGLALLALVGVGTAAGGAVLAQDATSTPSTTLQEATPAAGSSTTEDATEEDERSAFIDAFAAQLGVTDEATI